MIGKAKLSPTNSIIAPVAGITPFRTACTAAICSTCLKVTANAQVIAALGKSKPASDTMILKPPPNFFPIRMVSAIKLMPGARIHKLQKYVNSSIEIHLCFSMNARCIKKVVEAPPPKDCSPILAQTRKSFHSPGPGFCSFIKPAPNIVILSVARNLPLFVAPLLQPLPDARLFSLVTWLVIMALLDAVGQILLYLRGRRSIGVLDLHVFVVVVRVFIVFAVVEVLHQLCRRVTNLQRYGIVTRLLHILLYATICSIQGVALGRGSQVHDGLRQREIGLRQPDEMHRLLRGHADEQRLWIGHADVF